MRIFTANKLNTTTMVYPTSGTATTQNLFDGNVNVGYVTDGYTSDTSCVVSVDFGTPTVLSNVFIQNHNLKDFRVFYNSATANSLFTATSSSDSSTYIGFASLTVQSIQIQIDSAQSTGERLIGELVLCENTITFSRNPSFKQYKPKIYRKQVRHEMADGGVTLFQIRDRYRATLDFDYITSSEYSTFKSVYDAVGTFYFAPFPTTTAWDGNAYDVVWPGDFVFNHSTNDKQQGYSGKMTLEQTSSQ